MCLQEISAAGQSKGPLAQFSWPRNYLAGTSAAIVVVHLLEVL
jgi:hypothetical protein